MSLSDRAQPRVLAPAVDVDQFQKGANDRKRDVYWIGFLQGALSSNRIESGEEDAILAEADKFVEFFEDPDAADLAEDNHRSGFGIFASIVMFERETELPFQMPKSVPAIANELRPCPTRNFYTVTPCPVRRVLSRRHASSMDRTFVKAAVLDEMVPRKEWRETRKSRAKVWRFGNVLWPDAMQLDVKAAEPHAWVHKGCKSFNPIVRPDAGDTNLTNACGVTAGSLDIKSDKPEVSTR
jgi:hypothetical protein